MDANRRLNCRVFNDEDNVFDNRSISLPTDFPSANLLLSRGIHRAAVIEPACLTPQTDLALTRDGSAG